MANTLTGQNIRVQWTDFAGPVPSNRPADQTAFTSASFSISNFSIVPAYAAIGIRMPRGQNDMGFVIDNLRIHVTLNRVRMWSVASSRTPELLTHEQGHYDIVALVMSDLFIDLVNPPTAFLATPQAVQESANTLIAEAQRRIRVMESSATQDGLYDRQTNHSRDAVTQAKWNRAFSNARPPVGMRFDLSLETQGIIV